MTRLAALLAVLLVLALLAVLSVMNPATGLLAGSVLALVLTAFGRERA